MTARGGHAAAMTTTSTARRALRVRPGYAEAVLQLADLEFATQRAAAALKRVLDHLTVTGATPELLLLGWRAADAQQERGVALGLAQRLRPEFPDSPQAKQLPGAAPQAAEGRR